MLIVLSTYDPALCGFPTMRIQDLPDYSLENLQELQEAHQERIGTNMAMASILVNNKVDKVLQI